MKNRFLANLALLIPIFLISGCEQELEKIKSDFGVKIDSPKHLTPKARLGKLIFFDKNLSSPTGESCATCHDPFHGFEDIESREESEGAVKTRAGNRNAPTAAYAAFCYCHRAQGHDCAG